jgi:hypothetical protein
VIIWEPFMRRRLVTLALAVLVLVAAVPFVAAFSFERGPVVISDAVMFEPAVSATGRALLAPWREAGTLAVTGGLLLGLASIVRRSRA